MVNNYVYSGEFAEYIVLRIIRKKTQETNNRDCVEKILKVIHYD